MAGPYVTPTDKAVPCCWVVEKDAVDRVPMLIETHTFDETVHVRIDEDGEPIGDAEPTPTSRKKK